MSATVIDFRCARVGGGQISRRETASGGAHGLQSVCEPELASPGPAEQAGREWACPVMRLRELMAIAYSMESWD